MNQPTSIEKSRTAEEFLKGIWKENPVFVPVLGLVALGVLVAVDKPGTRIAGPTGERPSASGA